MMSQGISAHCLSLSLHETIAAVANVWAALNSPEDEFCSQNSQGTLTLLLSWEGCQLVCIKDVALMGYIWKCPPHDDIKWIYIFKTKVQVFKITSEQCRSNGKTNVENLGYLLASDVDSAGESFLGVVL